jgi:FtsH-binding integral membrane protein
MSENAAGSLKQYTFQDLSVHSRWLKRLLIGLGIISIVAVVSGVLEHQLLSELIGGADADSIQARAESSDFRQQIIGWLQVLISVSVLVTFAWWIVRACRNAHAISDVRLTFSPAWSLGWYCIPIANLWKPYQAMKQIWNVSEDPKSDVERPGSSLLQLWWFVFLVDSTLGRVAFKYTMKAETLDQLLTANILTIASDVFGIIAVMVAYKLINTIQLFQSKHAD